MARPIRVLHVVPYFPPDRVGGVGEATAHLHRGLLSLGHDSLVLTGGISRDDPLVRRVGRTPAGFVLRCWQGLDLTRDRDVVHCHHGDALLLLLLMRFRGVRVPILATFHVGSQGLGDAARPYRVEGHRFGGGFRNWAYRTLSAPVHRFVDWCTLRMCNEASFVSASAARDILGHSRAVTARVIYNGLPLRGAEHRDPSPPATDLLYVGKRDDRKRVNVLPFVLRRIRDARPGTRLRIVGFEVDDHADVRELFERFHLRDAVVCEGTLTSGQLRPFYSASKVLVVPSAYEGLPMVMLEAQQAGLPCVATRVCGHPEVIEDGVNGFLVALDNPSEMAARCLDILTSPTVQQRMGDRARRLVAERFSLSRHVDECVALYRLQANLETPHRRHDAGTRRA